MWQEIIKTVEAYDSFLITSHINPDGDALGSEAALKFWLEELGKTALIVNSSPTPDNLAFLDPDGEIHTYNNVFETVHFGQFPLNVYGFHHTRAACCCPLKTR